MGTTRRRAPMLRSIAQRNQIIPEITVKTMGSGDTARYNGFALLRRALHALRSCQYDVSVAL